MIQTEVKELGPNEYDVRVHVADTDYAEVYERQVQRVAAQASLPGFRPGKLPRNVVEQQFGAKLREETVSELVQANYAEAIESSGLTPAVQPELDVPEIQPASGFDFTLKVVTWPDVEPKALDKLSFTRTEVEVTDADVQGVVDRLMKGEVSYEPQEDREAEHGDELHIDFTGYVGDEPFEGGQGENMRMVLGEGRFLPDFEEGLKGAKVGEERSFHVQFPDDYGHAPLAGQKARFDAQVRQVAVPSQAEDEEALAKMLGFDSLDALKSDIREKLEGQAEQAAYESNRKAMFDALIEANSLELPEPLVRQDMRQTMTRVAKSMREQGQDPTNEQFEQQEFQNALRENSEYSLKVSLLLQSVREQGKLEVSDSELEAELDKQAEQYPEEQREQFKQWMHSQREQVEGLRNGLLEKKCVEFMMSKAKAKTESMNLSEWQAKQDEMKEAA
ncbi:MAG TPA: trigger factor [Mariprofundaceae bacterium]|nr:trigger factor [Mariprofundaceae bacterium]